ncbi:MAG: PA2779 family protein [Verrucomicrobia bacterium]|nr:PA2779 family protein [Verrucomicrobiota bacterium]MCH8526461.1 PA2779 family protein [Kiritimatiellia bacterium]
MTNNSQTSVYPKWIRDLSRLLVLVFSLQAMIPQVSAGFIPSSMIGVQDSRTADLQTVQTVLESKIVRHRLQEIGFTAEEIEDRLAHASDEDLHQLAIHSENVMAGGSVVEVLLVVVLVLLILRLASVDNPALDSSVIA